VSWRGAFQETFFAVDIAPLLGNDTLVEFLNGTMVHLAREEYNGAHS